MPQQRQSGRTTAPVAKTEHKGLVCIPQVKQAGFVEGARAPVPLLRQLSDSAFQR